MKLYDCIIFDVDGTLIDSESVILSTLQTIVEEELHLKIKRSGLLFALGIPSEVTLRELGIQDIGRVTSKWNKYMKDKLELLKLFEGIDHMLSILSGFKATFGIVSSKSRDALNEIFKILDIEKYFKRIICKEDTKNHKPKPDPILEFIRRFDINASTAIYIGDTDYDMESATSAGVDFGLALWGARKNIETKIRFEQPAQIIEIIKK